MVDSQVGKSTSAGICDDDDGEIARDRPQQALEQPEHKRNWVTADWLLVNHTFSESKQHSGYLNGTSDIMGES